MARKAGQARDVGPARKQAKPDSAPPPAKSTSTKKNFSPNYGKSPKAGKNLAGTTKSSFNKDQPGGPTANSPAGKSANPGTANAQNVPKSAVRNQDVDGRIPNKFDSSKGVAPQKSYSVTTLRDGTGAKGAKGK